MERKLYSKVRFVQDCDDDYNRIDVVFSGLRDGYCEANSQPVIDYLSEWDGDENELTEEKPRIANYDTSYADQNGVYTLLYNSSVGGCFLLYREASEDELTSVAHGHLEYIIDLIPETEDVQDVTIAPKS